MSRSIVQNQAFAEVEELVLQPNLIALLDLDGCLVDFVKGSCKLHGIDKEVEEFYKDHKGLWNFNEIIHMSLKDFFAPMDYDFWVNLDWMVDGQGLFELVERLFGEDNLYICTSPSGTAGCLEGKRDWISKHLPKKYKYRTVYANHKFLLANPNHVLIDDSDKNVNDFKAKAGLTVLVPRIWNSDHELRHKSLVHVRGILEGLTIPGKY